MGVLKSKLRTEKRFRVATFYLLYSFISAAEENALFCNKGT